MGEREAISSFQNSFLRDGTQCPNFLPVSSCGYSPPLPSPHQLSAALWAISGEENILILFLLVQPCFMEQNSQEIRQSTERILQLGPSTKLFTLWWSSVLNTIGWCVETWNISSINLLYIRLSSTLIWRCDLTEMSNKFCFTVIISKLRYLKNQAPWIAASLSMVLICN